MNAKKETKKKVLKGTVVSDKMKDTAVVRVAEFIKHPKYKKYYKRSKNYKAHDTGNTAGMGDSVAIEKVRPISKDKHFKVIEVIPHK